MIKYLLILFTFTGLVFAAPVATATWNFRIDTNHSNIGFAVPIAGGLSKVRGKFSDFEMKLQYDPEDITRSTVDVNIKAASVDTGIDQRDNHLRTADFFDVENHSSISFKSKKIIKKDGRLILVGDFTMRDVTKEISFPFTITGREEKGEGQDKRVTMGFFAKLVLDRTKFNVNYQHGSVPNFIGNDVEIDLNIMTRVLRPNKPPKKTD
ncbi:MAG: YceI family protein [Pyrinomonadaceae bacterium]|nr:YceI family protein [Pyrinomonadaceae bacterium]